MSRSPAPRGSEATPGGSGPPSPLPRSPRAHQGACCRGTAMGGSSGVGPGPREDRLRGVVPRALILLLGVPVAIVAVTLAMSPHDYVAAGHCWLNVHTDTIWAFVGPVLFVLTANTCILVRVVMVTVASARRRARMLSPQPCLQEQVRIQTWATVKPVLVLLPVLGLTWLVGVLVHLSPAWAYAAVGLNSFQVWSALQRMTEKKTTEAFTACSSPMGPGSRLRFLGPWEVAQDNPVALVPARRHLAVRGTRSPRIPTTFSSIAERERPGVELTAFKASGPPSWPHPSQSPYPDASWAETTSKPGAAPVGTRAAAAPPRSSDSAFVSAEWVSRECERTFLQALRGDL
uniref:uncharacterized protein LOC118549985 n=1 Tax=Halichoerus grypus TaxID=9711 RepID=UPI00165A007C|nr:uncharacterized protein LOC118549985 [Halichoerus grypus]